jgi:hypothetical protein
LFRVWPLDATGSIDITYKARYLDFVLTDYIPWNPVTIKYQAAIFVASVDGTTPMAMDQWQKIFTESYARDCIADTKIRTSLGSGYNLFTQWSFT